MKSAVVERLEDLERTCEAIREILDSEGRRLRPGLLVARIGVAADEAASRLQIYLMALAANDGQVGGDDGD
jgi:hypothetical protein